MDTPDDASRRWQLEGASPEAYEEYLVPEMLAPWAEVLVDRVALLDDDRVLDVGCGTGVVARAAAGRVGEEGRVVGIDVNEGMLEVAAEVAPEASEGGAPIEWRAGDAEDLPFPEESFDVVLSQQTLQFVTNPARALEEMHRVLAPYGRVGIAVWRALEHNPAYGPMADALERHVGEEAGSMMRSPFPSWSAGDLEEMLDRAGFGDVRVEALARTMRYPSIEEFLRREAASSPLAGPIGALEEETRNELLRELGEALAAHEDARGQIFFPMECHVVTARGTETEARGAEPDDGPQLELL